MRCDAKREPVMERWNRGEEVVVLNPWSELHGHVGVVFGWFEDSELSPVWVVLEDGVVVPENWLMRRL